MEENEFWENDCESTPTEIQGVVYTAISLLGCLIALGVVLLAVLY